MNQNAALNGASSATNEKPSEFSSFVSDYIKAPARAAVHYVKETFDDEKGPHMQKITSVGKYVGDNGDDSPRHLVLCFDGTENQFSNYNSNVMEFFKCLRKDRDKQIVYYQTGIGTYTPPWLSTKPVIYLSKKLDSAIAWNLEHHVQAAYRFLMQNYKPGDNVSLFGFSRGAYTARVLAGFLQKVGLLPHGNIEQIPFAWKHFVDSDTEEGSRLCQNYKNSVCSKVEITVLGLWDTVASVGLYGKELPLLDPERSGISFFRQALALDERRAFFRPNFKDTFTGPREDARVNRVVPVKEVWFAGCHSDVGGGEVWNGTRNSLARISLRWMIKECLLARTGIQFDFTMMVNIGFVDIRFAFQGMPKVPAVTSPDDSISAERELMSLGPDVFADIVPSRSGNEIEDAGEDVDHGMDTDAADNMAAHNAAQDATQDSFNVEKERKRLGLKYPSLPEKLEESGSLRNFLTSFLKLLVFVIIRGGRLIVMLIWWILIPLWYVCYLMWHARRPIKYTFRRWRRDKARNLPYLRVQREKGMQQNNREEREQIVSHDQEAWHEEATGQSSQEEGKAASRDLEAQQTGAMRQSSQEEGEADRHELVAKMVEEGANRIRGLSDILAGVSETLQVLLRVLQGHEIQDSVEQATQDDEDMADALSPIHDQLSLNWAWWFLEWPSVVRLQKDKRKEKETQLNFGQGRRIYGDAWNRSGDRKLIYVHKSVFDRMKKGYKPHAWFRFPDDDESVDKFRWVGVRPDTKKEELNENGWEHVEWED